MWQAMAKQMSQRICDELVLRNINVIVSIWLYTFYDKFICIWLTKLLKAYSMCVFALFYRSSKLLKARDRRGSSSHYLSSFWYLLEMYIARYGMYRLVTLD